MILLCKGKCGLQSHENFAGADESTSYLCRDCSGSHRLSVELTYDRLHHHGPRNADSRKDITRASTITAENVEDALDNRQYQWARILAWGNEVDRLTDEERLVYMALDARRIDSTRRRAVLVVLLMIYGDPAELTDEERSAFRAVVIEAKSVRVAARETGISKSNVKAVSDRATAKLSIFWPRLREALGSAGLPADGLF